MTEQHCRAFSKLKMGWFCLSDKKRRSVSRTFGNVSQMRPPCSAPWCHSLGERGLCLIIGHVYFPTRSSSY